MRCSQCGGLVEWKGPISNLTHTECNNCGGVNCQEIEPEFECDDCWDSGYIESYGGGIWTGEGVTVKREICHCLCGDDVRRERDGIPINEFLKA